MYNVLLVDDERVVLKGLSTLVDWEALKISSVLTAENMKQAIEVYAKNEIHVMVCDIEMPGGSGLELIKWVREYSPQTVTLLLTCHESFKYVKEAIKLGAFEYMLKPIPRNELEDVLKRAIENYNYLSIANKVVHKEGDEVKIIDRVKRIVLKNLSNELTREQIAEEVFINPQYLSRLFRKEEGISLSDYILKKRIELSKYYLESTEDNIGSIAERVGYKYSTHFAKMFKKETGMSPHDYRNQFRAT